MNRIFLACTPRTGNLWFRKMLARAMGGLEVAAHSPGEIPWNELEAPCIVAMHWHRTPEFSRFLAQNGFETIVIVRNPLDVLISILHFSQYEPATAHWLSGEEGNETRLRGVDPASPVFLDYALSRRASLLLHVSAEWHGSAREVIRYEELAADPEGILDLTLRSLHCEPAAASSRAVQEHSVDHMKSLPNHHFWRGEPGLWRRLLPPDSRHAIYEQYRDLFELWGYERPDDFALAPEKARANWHDL